MATELTVLFWSFLIQARQYLSVRWMESGSVFLLIGCGHKPSVVGFFFWRACGRGNFVSLVQPTTAPGPTNLAHLHHVEHRRRQRDITCMASLSAPLLV